MPVPSMANANAVAASVSEQAGLDCVAPIIASEEIETKKRAHPNAEEESSRREHDIGI